MKWILVILIALASGCSSWTSGTYKDNSHFTTSFLGHKVNVYNKPHERGHWHAHGHHSHLPSWQYSRRILD